MITDEELAQLRCTDEQLLAEFRESMNQKLDWSDSPTNLQVEDMLSFYLGGDVR